MDDSNATVYLNHPNDHTMHAAESDATVRKPLNRSAGSSGRALTILDGNRPPVEIRLDDFRKDKIIFGRNGGSMAPDIELQSPIVSRPHGQFVLEKGKWIIQDLGSANGILQNQSNVNRQELNAGDIYRIDSKTRELKESVLFLVTDAAAQANWKQKNLDRDEILIGRESSCDVVLPDPGVSRRHAAIRRDQSGWILEDLNSANGLLVNGQQVEGHTSLREKDVITIISTNLIFTSGKLYICTYHDGISVEANDVVVVRKNGRKKLVTSDHVSLRISPGELVSIIGGSGAGKSTIMNVLCGYLPPREGQVYINGINLYENFNHLKKFFGYVPQMDIVYDNLTLHDMLQYTAELRLPPDTSKEEREKAIDHAIGLVELREKKNVLIKNLSGGQRKRASIAVELLSDPKLLFLDEPASGLDPGTERSLMTSLRRMADMGKTIILVTHSTLQLGLCDKIVFMGRGGQLCFCGNDQEAKQFFGVSDLVDVYGKITEKPGEYRRRYELIAPAKRNYPSGQKLGKQKAKKRLLQLSVMSRRYMKLVVNDRQRLMLLMLQAPMLAFLISLVADGEQFRQYEMTKSLYFCLSCCGFWVGMLNAIQEICKERTILKREYMTGLSLSSYVTSKIMVLGLLCLVQSALLTGMYVLLIGLPEKGLVLTPFLEMLVTTWLTALSSAAMGLFVSSLFNNPDRAMTVAPLLLMPQMLFSGILFKLSGSTELLSWLTICRWSMEGYGTSANLNAMSLAMQQSGYPVVHEAEEFFEYTVPHLLRAWGMLLGYMAVFLGLSRISLFRIRQDSK